MKTLPLSLLIFFNSIVLFAQVDTTSEIFKTLKAKDSLIFDLGFNKCDIPQFEINVSEDFEFYHDTAGLTTSKDEFITMFRDGVCKMEYKAIRKLVPNSLEVFTLKKNGDVYGALQKGIHKFYAIQANQPEYFTSVAKFTNV